MVWANVSKLWELTSVGWSPTVKYVARGFNREIIRMLLVSSLQAQWEIRSCLNPYKTSAGNGSSGTCSFRSVCLYLRTGHASPEQRRPSQTSYRDISDSISIQIHDSMYGLTEEFHLLTVPTCRDPLRRHHRTSESVSTWT